MSTGRARAEATVLVLEPWQVTGPPGAVAPAAGFVARVLLVGRAFASPASLAGAGAFVVGAGARF